MADRRPSVAVLIGSLRKASFTRRVAEALIKLSPGGARIRDRRDRRPAALQPGPRRRRRAARPGSNFATKIEGRDAVLFVDAGIQPFGPGGAEERARRRLAPLRQERLELKAGRRSSASRPGAMGGFGANHHLRQSLVFLNMPALNQPEAYVGNAAHLIADDRTVAVESTRNFLAGFMIAYEAWVARTGAAARLRPRATFCALAHWLRYGYATATTRQQETPRHAPQQPSPVQFRPRRERRHDPRVRAQLRRQGDRAARGRDRPRQPVPARPLAQDGRARAARDHRAGGIRRPRASAISSIASRSRKSRAPRPRSASPTARTPISASTRSCATARRRRRRAICPS